MALLTQTIQEARDHILTKIKGKSSTEYQDLVLEILNMSIAAVCMLHDWKFIRAKNTLTMPDATGVVSLPTDLDRILAIHKTGSNYLLQELSPIDFESEKVNEDVNPEPVFFCFLPMAQNDDTSPAYNKIEITPAPASGTAYNLWYIKTLPEYTSNDLDHVPPFPPYIWELVMHKAIAELMSIAGNSSSDIKREEGMFAVLLSFAKQRENLGSSRAASIRHSASVSNYFATRGRQR